MSKYFCPLRKFSPEEGGEGKKHRKKQIQNLSLEGVDFCIIFWYVILQIAKQPGLTH
ncbi:hypothetical protein [Scytonema hofmannii]|uniref:hypothetical protein n=1 Tax=Scytonema hofmannii TaxID=34078 RepID=UPI001313DBC8|nr:hypothetical protein [Scytonema hofmannii]